MERVQARGKRVSAQWVHASRSLSASKAPTSCTPSGNPCGPVPHGSVTQGTPSSVLSGQRNNTLEVAGQQVT